MAARSGRQPSEHHDDLIQASRSAGQLVPVLRVIRQSSPLPLVCRKHKETLLRLLPLILLCALALAACSGQQQQPPPWLRPTEKPRDENYHGGNAAMLLKHDANHDGTLTRDELVKGLKAEFAAHDTSHKGCLDPEQAGDINQARVDADQSTATPVMDWNQDGCIDYTEFSAAPYSLFDQLDFDHDGKLTPKELQRAGAKPKDPDDAPPAGEEGERRGPPGR
jgi:Ca2+-binding EF-hand superfamily protein